MEYTFNRARCEANLDSSSGTGRSWPKTTEMSDTLERLRRLQSLRRRPARGEPPLPPAAAAEAGSQPAAAFPAGSPTLIAGDVLINPAGQCYLVTARYPLDVRRGARQLGGILARDPVHFSPHHPQFGLHRHLDFTQAAFIDTETTGLGGGAGIYAFMVGVGTFETSPGRTDLEFVVRQFFMRSPTEEAALLVALTDLLSRYAMTVTFNGRTFDLPLLRARLRYNAWAPALDHDGAALLAADRPHLDLLHPARRLWRRRLGSCRLINLEEQILTLHRSAEDVPGHLIPQMYADYVRSGDATEVNRIFYHNHEDIVSMVSLAERLGHILGAGIDELADAELVNEDWTSLGELYLQQEQPDAAEQAYRRGLATVHDPAERAHLFLRLGLLQKRAGRWHEASETWQRWISTVPGPDPTPYVELAKLCEWQVKDYEQAAMWTGWALHNLRNSASGLTPARRAALLAELEHRLARVQRKLPT